MFRGVPATRVKGADVLRYANLRLEEKPQPATINRELAALRAAYRLGLDNDTIVAMPRIRLLPENNARQGFADVKQVAAICRRLSPDLADAVQFMFITGWRSRSEVLPLRWPQVDLAGGFVRLEPGTTKNSEGRAFPLIPELRALLERRQSITRRCERAQGRIIAHVFHRYGRPIKTLRRAWRTACKEAGPGLLLHDLRRSAVRNLERAGISRSVAMKLTGHKTEAVYRRYAIVAESDLREECMKLAAALGAGVATGSLSDNSGDSAEGAIDKCVKKWWAGTGLNRRHQDFQSCALPTELPAHHEVARIAEGTRGVYESGPLRRRPLTLPSPQRGEGCTTCRGGRRPCRTRRRSGRPRRR